MTKHIVIAIAIMLALASCTERQKGHAAKEEYYTCSMHPQVKQDKPGTCPICHMELIVVQKTNTAADELVLNDEQIRLGNIQWDTIRNGTIGDKMVLTATLNTDETKVNSINARIKGRIDRLYFKNSGDYVSRGSPLYDLYSEELNTAKQEYLAALERKEKLDNSIIDFDRLLKSAKARLLLWGMTAEQVDELSASRTASPHTTFYSKTSGYITELPVMEGQYVTEGATIVKLADLSSLWAEAQVYASQLSAIEKNSMAVVEFPDLPGKKINAAIEFINPEIFPDTRVNLIRVSIPANGLLKPGMPAYVTVRSKEVKMLALPLDAVLRDGKSSIVWVRTAKNNFSMKMVQTGVESGDHIAIKSGLENGDVVVTSGAYLLNSEFVFKKGADAMSGMTHH